MESNGRVIGTVLISCGKNLKIFQLSFSLLPLLSITKKVFDCLRSKAVKLFRKTSQTLAKALVGAGRTIG